MEKIKTFGRQEVNFLSEEMLKELKPLMKKYGLTIRAKGGSFDTSFYDVKFHIEAPKAASQKAKSEFKSYADMYGIKAPFGFSYESGSHTFKVDGLQHNKPKNRISLKRNDGKLFQCSVEDINRSWKVHCYSSTNEDCHSRDIHTSGIQTI